MWPDFDRSSTAGPYSPQERGDVAKISPKPTNGSSTKHSRTIVETAGEIFADGAVIELVKPPDQRVQLLLWRKNKKTIAPQIKYGGRVYQVRGVNETLLDTIRFAASPVDYGSPAALFAEISALFTEFVGSTPREAALLTAWSCTTWFREVVSTPPTMVVSGPDMGHAITLFRLLGCICWRSLMLADVNRSSLLGLVGLHPTLLVNQPGEFPKLWQLLTTSNFHGVYVPGSAGKIYNLTGSRALFVGMQNTWIEGAIHIALPPARSGLPALNGQRQAEIADRVQAKFLMYRLGNLRTVQESHSTARQTSPSQIAHNLMSCTQDEPSIAQSIAPILRQYEEEAKVQNDCDVVRAILQVIWTVLHNRQEISIKRVADLTNAFLRTRRETLEYSAEEVGWKMKNLGFYRHRNGSSVVLRPSRENVLQVHLLARRLCLGTPPVEGCVDCTRLEVVVRE
jgi:hypothetical protein